MVTGSPFLSLTPLLFIVEPFSAISTMRRSVYLRRRSLPGRAAVHYLTDKVSSYLYPLPPSYVRSRDGDGERWYVIVRFFTLSCARLCFVLRFALRFLLSSLLHLHLLRTSALIHTIIVVSIPHALALSLGIVYYTKETKDALQMQPLPRLGYENVQVSTVLFHLLLCSHSKVGRRCNAYLDTIINEYPPLAG